MKLTIIGSTSCHFCNKTKDVANQRNIPYEYKVINRGEPIEELLAFGTPITMEEAVSIVGTPFRTIPQIIIDGALIGGYEDFLNYLNTKDLDIDEFKDMNI